MPVKQSELEHKLNVIAADGSVHYIVLYASPEHGYIRSATSGAMQPYHVGSSGESQYFKVTDATGTLGRYRTFFFLSEKEYRDAFRLPPLLPPRPQRIRYAAAAVIPEEREESDHVVYEKLNK